LCGPGAVGSGFGEKFLTVNPYTCCPEEREDKGTQKGKVLQDARAQWFRRGGSSGAAGEGESL